MDPSVTRVVGWPWGQEQGKWNVRTAIWGQECGDREHVDNNGGTRIWGGIMDLVTCASTRWPWRPQFWGVHSTPQLLVEPPWMPVMLWDWVTLTCQGSGTAGATTWYKDGRCWGQKGQDSFTVIQSGTYQFERPGSGLSPPVTVPNDTLVLQVPAPTLLEADTVTLRCCGPRNQPVRWVSFYRDGKELQTLRDRSLPPLQLNHSCRYHCRGLRVFLFPFYSVAVPETVTVQGEHTTAATPTPPQPLPRDLESQFPSPISSPELFMVPVLEGSPELPEGSPLNLSCLSTPSPLRPPAPRLYRFYQDGQLVGGPQGSPQLLVPAVGVSHSGSYSCEVRSEGGVRAEEQRPARRHGAQ
uniref:Ig-like domain-containing protein n=1 Tax=Catharus ustulatus TaxID=91951 RepID=A0A8C3Y531_CATUS